MDYIKYMDFFSIKFHFYTNNQPNFQNIFGGMMTFIYISICIGIFILISYDDINRLNPSTTVSEIPDSDSKLVNIKNEKIWIPFRIITEKNKYIDHRGILYILPYYVEGKYKQGMGIDLKYHLLNYRLCNETTMSNKPENYKIDVSLNELFCIEQDDILFGGNWNEDFINYIEINLYLCKDGINFNASDPRCSKIEDFLNNKNTSLSFDFYYPIVQFQPKNLKTPMSVIYKHYFYRLSSNSFKIGKLYLHEHILSDDKNMIRYHYSNSSYWGINTFYDDDYFLSTENLQEGRRNTSRIYSLNIYMDDGYIFYTRSYKKIILIISDVFPILRFIYYFIKKFTQHAKRTLIKRNLSGLIFENNEPKSKKIIQNTVENLNQQINKLRIESNKSNKGKDKTINLSMNNNPFSKKNLNNIINLKKNNDNINEIQNQGKENNNENNKSNINLNNESAFKVLNTKEIQVKDNKKGMSFFGLFKVKKDPQKVNNNKKPKKQRYIFPYYFFFLDIIFDKLIKPEKFFGLPKSYFTVYNFMCQIYDISTHIILFKQFNSLNNLVLEKMYEDDGVCPSKPYKKINIGDEKTVEKLNKDLKVKKSILFSNNLL